MNGSDPVDNKNESVLHDIETFHRPRKPRSAGNTQEQLRVASLGFSLFMKCISYFQFISWQPFPSLAELRYLIAAPDSQPSSPELFFSSESRGKCLPHTCDGGPGSNRF